jgi:hypothetical protein
LPKSFLFKVGSFFREEEPEMRIARLIYAGSIAALAAAAAPALAKNTNLNSHAGANAQKIEDQPASQGCHAYQQAPDGSWTPLSCQEGGPTAPAHGKSAARHLEEDAR